MSRLPFELLLALRYLRPKRTFVSIITLISVLGVTLGVAVLIIVISVMTGFDRDIRDRILGVNAHLKIYKLKATAGGGYERTTMPDYAKVLSIVNANKDVKAATPFILGPVLLTTEPPEGVEPQVAAPFLRGMEPSTETNVSLIATNIVDGKFDLHGNGLLVGVDFASNLGLRVGDRVAIYSPKDLEKMVRSHKKGQDEVIPASDYEIRGIYDAGYYDYNANVVASSLENAQELYRLDDDIHGLMILLKDPYLADAVRKQLQQALGPDYFITVWNEENTAMMAVIVEKNVMMYILFFIVIVAAFGITCTLTTFVVLKTREVGVLKALGANSRQVTMVFLSQSLGVSVLGILIGLGTGMLAVTYRNEFLHLMRKLTGMELFPAKIYQFSELPAKITPSDILVICGGSLVICLLAAAFPAWNAGRLKPVEALRHE